MLKVFFVWGSKKILSDICRINTSEHLKFDVILFLVGCQVSALPLNLTMAHIIPWAGREFYYIDHPVICRTKLKNSSLEAPGITTECSNFWKFESSSFKQGYLPHAIKYECKKAFSYYKENSSELLLWNISEPSPQRLLCMGTVLLCLPLSHPDVPPNLHNDLSK